MEYKKRDCGKEAEEDVANDSVSLRRNTAWLGEMFELIDGVLLEGNGVGRGISKDSAHASFW